MRRADVAVVIGILLFLFLLIPPALVRSRQRMMGYQPEQIPGMTRVTRENFQQEVQSYTERRVLLVFYAQGMSEPESQFWAQFARRNRQIKLVGIDKVHDGKLWQWFNGDSGRTLTFLWIGGTTLPLHLTADMSDLESQIAHMSELFRPARR